MNDGGRYPHVRLVAVGLLGLAAAMGIGRFAFTPLLPLMQDAFGLTIRQGGVLASANYLGYLAGAWVCTRIGSSPRVLARTGLAIVAVSTLGMAATRAMPAWLFLRFAAGVASAFVLIGVSSWVLPRLAALGRQRVTGWVFAGVGVGIGAVGLVCRALGILGVHPDVAWLVLAAVAVMVAAAVWPALGTATEGRAGRGPHGEAASPDGWRLVICYGALGFGYIVPATFLPAIARHMIPDPAQYGWVWPVFGAAAAVSTVVASTVLWRHPPRRVWAWSQAILAVGVLGPALSAGAPMLLFSALVVGGTFMVITMAGLQEASRVAGQGAQRLIARMTTAFALGQLAGPLLTALAPRGTSAFGFAGVTASIVLLATAVALAFPHSGARRT
ncbi:MAG: YbfB/YjiJ family MFS transporter [Betaproteobacteria bacterium]|nr:YbfB/YjiJ family MFS transporter [Betaproteobacteria bacterium]